jgi:hypothetical protein
MQSVQIQWTSYWSKVLMHVTFFILVAQADFRALLYILRFWANWVRLTGNGVRFFWGFLSLSASAATTTNIPRWATGARTGATDDRMQQFGDFQEYFYNANLPNAGRKATLEARTALIGLHNRFFIPRSIFHCCCWEVVERGDYVRPEKGLGSSTLG